MFSENSCTSPFGNIVEALANAAESVDTTDEECLHSFSESENGSPPACWVDVIDEIVATLDACNANSSQSRGMNKMKMR